MLKLKTMKKIVYIITFLFITSISFGEISDPKGLFKEGNIAYDSSDYEKATEIFQTLVDENYQSKELYYNLGNTYYKLGNLSKSILYYEKALKLSPNWEKAIKNLSIARKSLIDKHEKSREGFVHWISSFIGFSADFWAWLSILCFFFGWIAFVVYKRLSYSWKKRLAYIKFIFFTGAFVLLLFLSFMKYQSETQHYGAIVNTPSVTLKAEPNLTSESVFVLHEGSKIVVLSSQNGWIEARFGSTVGWVEEESLSFI